MALVSQTEMTIDVERGKIMLENLKKAGLLDGERLNGMAIDV